MAPVHGTQADLLPGVLLEAGFVDRSQIACNGPATLPEERSKKVWIAKSFPFSEAHDD